MKILRFVLGVAVAAGLVAGCGGSRQDYVSQSSPIQNTGSFQLLFQNSALPADVDSAQFVFKDAAGNRLGNVLELPLQQSTTVSGVPLNTATVEIDYLRNGGFALFESQSSINLSGVRAQATAGNRIVDPTLTVAQDARTAWTTRTSPAQFLVSVTGGPGVDGPTTAPTPFKVKGVGYSPTPIGVDVKFSPHLGDYFWDGGQDIPGNGKLKDWEKVWQRDIENIRGRFNSVRIYTMLAVHLNDNGSFPDFNSPNVRTHRKFLDAMWNNGNDPVYCLIGLPIPAGIYTGTTGNQAEIQFWEENLQRTVSQLASHPAVMGFTLFNEQGGESRYWGGNAGDSNTYWSKIAQFSQTASNAAPDKLVGFANFDTPALITSADGANLLTQFGSSLDFWGVNAAQAVTLEGTLAPYRALTTAAKPVLFTELGNPATTHTITDICSGVAPTQAGADSITTTSDSIAKAAQALANVLPQAVSDNVVAGVFVFEYTDEWWKQEGVNGCFTPRGASRQDGGVGASVGAKANGYDDEEGYGLYGIGLSRGRSANDVFSPFGNEPNAANLNPDTLTPRGPMLDAVDAAFKPVR